MPLSLADRVGETTTTTGTGTINLAGAKTGYQGFVAAGLNGLVVPYVIAHQSADEWEVGYGTVTDAATDTLSRTAVYSSSNAGSLVSFSAGTKDVYLTQPANLLRQTGAPFWVSISPTTSNYSAAVNKKYKADISGLTASRNFIIPSGAEGDWIELYIGTGDDTYAFVVIGDTGVSINGGSTATEWSRLFITNEYIRLECDSANNWKVKDGRIPCTAEMTRDTVETMTTGAFTKISLATQQYDVGDIADPTTNNRFNIRRTNKYLVLCFASVQGIDDQEYVLTACYKNASEDFRGPAYRVSASATDNTQPGLAIGTRDYSVGDYIDLRVFHTEGANQSTGTTVNVPRMTVIEQLGR